MKNKFGVVIVTYNRLPLLKECIENVLTQSRKFDIITIVNNNSTDGTLEYLEQYQNERSHFQIINLDANLGGAGGFKIGVEKSYKLVDYLLLIDDDAMLCTNFIEDIEKNLSKGIVAYSGSVQTNGIIDKTHRKRIKNWIFLSKQNVPEFEYMDKDYFDYDLATFCGLMVRTDIIDKIGLPKEEYFIWYDDSEYSMRILKFSKIRNINSAIINHKTTLSYADRLTWKSYYGYRNMIDMGALNSTIPVFYKLSRYTYMIVRSFQYKLLSLINSGEDKAYYKFASKMMIDVLCDSYKNKLGVNKNYLPGKK